MIKIKKRKKRNLRKIKTKREKKNKRKYLLKTLESTTQIIELTLK